MTPLPIIIGWLSPAGLASIGIAVLQTPPSILPEKPVWFVAIVLFVWGTVKLLDAIGRLMERSRERKEGGHRATDETALRAKIKEQLDLVGTVGDIDIAAEQILAKMGDVEDRSTVILAALEAGRKHDELVDGMLEMMLARVEDASRLTLVNAETLKSVATESLVLRSAGKVRHDIAGLFHIHVLRQSMDPTKYPVLMTKEELLP